MSKRKPMWDMSDVDATGSAERYAHFIGEADEPLRAIKERSYRLLQLRPGLQVLDVGAGTGDDLVALAERVGPGGRVVGVEKSRDFLREARRRVTASGAAVELLQGDAHALELPDAGFDACRAERLLQHVGNPAAVLAEMKRVTRPGGLVMVIDADFGTLSIDASDRDVTRTVIRRRADVALHGRIGKELYRRFRDAGLEVLAVEGVTWTWTSHEPAIDSLELEAIVDQAVADGETTRTAADAWLAELAERGRRGCFFLASTGYVLLGRKVIP